MSCWQVDCLSLKVHRLGSTSTRPYKKTIRHHLFSEVTDLRWSSLTKTLLTLQRLLHPTRIIMETPSIALCKPSLPCEWWAKALASGKWCICMGCWCCVIFWCESWWKGAKCCCKTWSPEVTFRNQSLHDGNTRRSSDDWGTCSRTSLASAKAAWPSSSKSGSSCGMCRQYVKLQQPSHIKHTTLIWNPQSTDVDAVLDFNKEKTSFKCSNVMTHDVQAASSANAVHRQPRWTPTSVKGPCEPTVLHRFMHEDKQGSLEQHISWQSLKTRQTYYVLSYFC